MTRPSAPVPCPWLPDPDPALDWRCLNAWRGRYGEDFYQVALTYGNTLWVRGMSARAVLAVDRALIADVPEDSPVLEQWPLPYRALVWMLVHNPPDTFIGNPRVHYQHLADRVKGERADQKKWRCWAMWALTRHHCPAYESDPKHEVEEPGLATIAAGLENYGLAGEVALWEAAFKRF
jgi:hypothetical protein